MKRLIVLAAVFLTTAAWAEDPKANMPGETFPDTRWGKVEGGVEASVEGQATDPTGPARKQDLTRFMDDVIHVYPIEGNVSIEAAPVYKFVCVLEGRLGTLEEPLDRVNYIETADDRPIRDGRPCIYHYKSGGVLGFVRING